MYYSEPPCSPTQLKTWMEREKCSFKLKRDANWKNASNNPVQILCHDSSNSVKLKVTQSRACTDIVSLIVTQ